MEKSMVKSCFFVKSSHGNLNSYNPITDYQFRPTYVNAQGRSKYKQAVQPDCCRNGMVYYHYHQNIVKNGTVHPKRGNISEPKSLTRCDLKRPTKEVYALNISETNLQTHTNSLSGSLFRVPLSAPRRSNSFHKQHPWSDIDDVVFYDDRDDEINSQAICRLERDTANASLVSNNTRELRGCQRGQSISNALPIKGILKSGSQSSYSSFTNENSSDGDTPTSNNSQKSSEISSIGSKVSSKKKVHFEERVITKIIVPFSAHTYSNDSVFHDTGQLVAMNNINIRSDGYNGMNFKENETDERNNKYNPQKDYVSGHCFENYGVGYSNDLKMMYESQHNERNDSVRYANVKDDFRGERGESEVSLFPHFIQPSKDIQNAYNRKLSSTYHLLSQDLKLGNNDEISGDVIEVGGSVKSDECKTAFPYCPSSKSTNAHSDTAVEIQSLGRMTPNTKSQCEKDLKHKWSQDSNSTDDKKLSNFSRVKFLQAQSVSPEEKTLRILDWLDDVKASGRPRSNSVSLLMMPRPMLFRRPSFVGE